MAHHAPVEQRVEELRRQIAEHDRRYYIEARPTISDRDYDRLMRELVELETAHPELRSDDSPSMRVGGAPIERFVTVEHAVPMLSIDNSYDPGELRAFDQRIRKSIGASSVEYVLEPKVDGVAVSLRYEAGRLVTAATRGDGRRGDDITANVRTIRSVPLTLPDDAPRILEVRGEIFMDDQTFQSINRGRADAGEETYANPRNFTAGTLKQLDPKIVASRNLRFVCHGVGQIEPQIAERYWDLLGRLRALGLPVSPHARQADSIEQAIEIIDAFGQTRGTLGYQTDGMVVKVDRFDLRQQLGATSRSPRWVLAFKYPAEQVQTTLLAVTWQVGKGGTLTPVAELEPVLVAGTTVRRASLHNIEQIERLGLRIGAKVVIEKAGEIIPQVKLVADPGTGQPVTAPTRCPSCDQPVEKETDGPYIRCDNAQCPAQLKERLRWFAARGQMDIDGLGEVLIDQLVDAGKLKGFADIYRLTRDDLLSLERTGEKTAAKVLQGIDASRGRPLERLLAGLGIRHVGTRAAQLLSARFGSLDAIAAAPLEQLASVHEIGPAIAGSVKHFFDSDAGRQTLNDLRSVGLDPRQAPLDPSQPAELPLSGKTVAVTGTLEQFDRQAIEQRIRELGGKASGSVSKKTSFLLAGANAGSKLEKARELGVEILDEKTFIERFGRG